MCIASLCFCVVQVPQRERYDTGIVDVLSVGL